MVNRQLAVINMQYILSVKYNYPNILIIAQQETCAKTI